MRPSFVTFAPALLLASLAWVHAAQAQPPYVTADEPRDRVDLRAQLDATAHRIEGTLRWRFTNRSSVAVTELYWHLYLNAFRSEGSVFTREEGSSIRGREVTGAGSITVRTLRLADGCDLLARSTTSVGVADDLTQLRTTLFEPLPPGGSLDLRVTFVSQLPEAVARSGFAGDFHVAAQWFPKLARLEPDGRWAHFPYHGLGEFYADFADYTLEVLAPADMRVFAGGVPLAPEAPREGAQRHRFEAQAVHDVVFVAAPSLRVIEQVQALPTHDVRVRVVHPAGFERAAVDHMRVSREGLAYFSRVFGDYPYPVLTVVVPTAEAEAVSGMEYPTLFFTSGPWWGTSTPLRRGAIETTAHELAHQWFQGVIATDEVHHPALDEGLTSWATGELLRERHGQSASAGSILGVTFDGFELDRSWGLAEATDRAPLSAVYEFETEGYFRTIYAYVPLVLETIARTWGRERLLRALGSYARAQRFAHPGPSALRAAFQEEYGDWFVRSVFDPAFSRGCVLHTELGAIENVCDAGGCRDEVVARRRGCLPLPLEVTVETDAGVTTHPWPGAQRELRLRVDPATLRRVQVDPSRHNLTDVRRRDDVRYFEAGGAQHAHSGASLTTRLLGLLHLFFSLVGP